MSQQDTTVRKPLIKTDYEPVTSSQKLNLLLQRSVRYSYRQKCCNLCPTVFCEILFPFFLIVLLGLSRYGINRLAEQMNSTPGSASSDPLNRYPCSQNITSPSISSNEIFQKCFQFPPRYKDRWAGGGRTDGVISNRTNIVFEPATQDTNELVDLAKVRLEQMKCDNNTNVWNQNANDEQDTALLKNETVNTVIVDLSPTNNVKTNRKIVYNIFVRTPNAILNNAPVDMSFISYKHPAVLSDHSNATDADGHQGSKLPEFADVKLFVDSLLMEYQATRSIQYEVQRKLMTCTPYRDDVLYTSVPGFAKQIMILIDGIFIVPFLILLSSLIREKNAKVKEILKVLGIEPVYNNFAQAIRTMIILLILVLLLCLVFKINFKPFAYFSTVNYGTVFLGYIIFSIQLVSFCIFQAQVFDSNSRAIIFTIGMYFLVGTISSYAMQWPTTIQYILMFFYPFMAEWSIFQQIALYDLANKDLAYFDAAYRNVTMFFPTLIIMIFSSMFYWILSWYLEKVFPGEFGVPQEWNFLFKRDYWRSASTSRKSQVFGYDNRASAISTDAIPMDQSDNHGTPVVHVDRLVKKFGPDKTAVNQVSFNLYENEITSLLGPNGSGKTTIFNCLIGIYKQTSGTITMANEYGVNCDTRTNLENLRKSIGYCPQHDILFDLLTIEEQIEFYASARGLRKYKKEIANEMLRKVSLEGYKDTFCRSLSGGMKRRLSLACAFVGDTRIILLDEPSSGLDPSNRRLLWDWLRTMKEGKTLLLTTHFMEESDALSDRIMIISNGNIKADGTSARLKETYGSGYKLVINKHNNFPTAQIQNQLRTYLPNITIESDAANDGDVVFRTNQLPDEQFVQSLRQLDQMKLDNQIKNYGVQNSTMDDVFLKITKEDKQDDETAVDVEHINEQCQTVFDQGQFYHGFQYYLSQLYGLLMKTLLVRYRRWGITLVVFLLPIVYNLLSNIISQSQSESGTFQMSVNSLNPQTILYRTDSIMENYFRSAIGSQSNGIKLEQRSDNISDMNQYIRQQRMDRPYTYTDIYLAFDVYASQSNNYTIKSLSSNLITGYEILSIASDTVYKHVLNDLSASIETKLIYKRVGNLTIEPTIGGILNLLSLASCYLKILPTSLILDVILFYLIFFYTTIFLTSERSDNFLSLLNISGLHPAFYWIYNYVFDIISSVIWFCYILAMYCLIDVAFNGSPDSRSTSQTTMPLEFATSWDFRVQFYPLTILIALPTFPFVYLFSKLIRSDILCGLAVLSILSIIHLVSIIVPIIMLTVKNTTAQYVVYWILNIISPTINSQAIITSILAGKSRFCQIFSMDNDFFHKIGDNTMGVNWAILFFHIFVFLTLLILIDCGLLKSLCASSVHSNLDEKDLDSDVRAERERILSSNVDDQTIVNSDDPSTRQHSDHLIVRDLVKSYRKNQKFAVDHLTFGAKRGEAFGLLGYNGAGKTTTFRILVGDETASEGTAFIDGQNVSYRLRTVRRLGYCPQENCSMEYLTVRDGLYLLARIRGVEFSRVNLIVQTMSSLFLLDPFLNNYIHQLSGGTKRRLHAALALIGPPLVVILDEPTTGVDPTARQQMQEIFLNAVKANLTIILTSHSMDECERVCNRLGIMFSGQFVCLGTIQHLKSKFGEGYTIEIKVRTTPDDTTGTTIQNVQNFLLSQQQYAISVREVTYSTGSFQVRQGTPADLFQLLEQNKQQLNIETYTISQTTLEQIFLSFGKKANEI